MEEDPQKSSEDFRKKGKKERIVNGLRIWGGGADIRCRKKVYSN